MIFTVNGRNVSNSLTVFNHYKRATGNSLEKDIMAMQRRQKILDDPNASAEAIEKALDVDPFEIIEFIYYAMRCAAEGKSLDPSTVIDELSVDDIMSGELTEAIEKLVNVKKNIRETPIRNRQSTSTKQSP
jgi:hypothetical protein